MPTVVTINHPDVVALIEVAANRLTGGDKTAAVAMALRSLPGPFAPPRPSPAPGSGTTGDWGFADVGVVPPSLQQHAF
jgi:hypothetical protein